MLIIKKMVRYGWLGSIERISLFVCARECKRESLRVCEGVCAQGRRFVVEVLDGGLEGRKERGGRKEGPEIDTDVNATLSLERVRVCMAPLYIKALKHLSVGHTEA
jgi:hypothetical protein